MLSICSVRILNRNRDKRVANLKKHKLDLWFRDDDAAKRNKWADLIQQYRLEIKAEIDAEVERGHSDTLVRNAK